MEKPPDLPVAGQNGCSNLWLIISHYRPETLPEAVEVNAIPPIFLPPFTPSPLSIASRWRKNEKSELVHHSTDVNHVQP